MDPTPDTASPLSERLQNDPSHVIRCFDLAMGRRQQCQKFRSSGNHPSRPTNFSRGTDLVKWDFDHTNPELTVGGTDNITISHHQTYMSGTIMFIRALSVNEWACYKE